VWLVADFGPERRWWREPFWELAIEAACPNRLDVYHIGQNGHVWGRRCATRFPDSRVTDLLETWLRLDVATAIEAKPFVDLLPVHGGGVDEEWAHEQMVAVAEGSADLRSALVEASNLASPYVCEAYSTFRDAWFCPLFVEHGKEGVLSELEFAGRARWARDFTKTVHDRDLIRVLKAQRWKERFLDLMPVRRAWGLVGLLWALLLDRLEGDARFNRCADCGSFIDGRRRFCHRDDNAVCYNRRRARDTRRSRSRADTRP